MASRRIEFAQLAINVSSQRMQFTGCIAARDRFLAELCCQLLALTLANELSAAQGRIRVQAQMPARGRQDSACALEQALTLQQFREQRRCVGVVGSLCEDFFEKQARRFDLAVLPKRLRGPKARVDIMTDVDRHRSNLRIPDRAIQHCLSGQAAGENKSRAAYAARHTGLKDET